MKMAAVRRLMGSEERLYVLCIGFIEEAKRLLNSGSITQQEYNNMVRLKQEFINDYRRKA